MGIKTSQKTFSRKNIAFCWVSLALFSSLLLSACQEIRSTPAVPTESVSTVVATPVPPSGPTLTPIPMADIEPKLVWFYKPPDDGDLQRIADNFEYAIMSNGDEKERDEIRKLGYTGPILQYLRFEVIHDPGSCTRQPRKNNVGNRVGDYCKLIREHPDWFLRDKDGDLFVNPYNGEDYVMTDPGNKFFRAFWLERAMEVQRQGGWDGIFLDNVEVTYRLRQEKDELPAQYPDEASYQAAVQGFLKEIQAKLKSENKVLFANLIGRRDDANWTVYLNHLDGVMHEGWSIDWPTGYRSVETWEKHMKLAEDTQAIGKTIILISQGKIDQENLQEFAYASYLLVVQGNAYFRYARSGNYTEAWLYPNYELDLGQPLGKRYKKGDTWRREFAHGIVEVNPKTHKVSIRLTSTP